MRDRDEDGPGPFDHLLDDDDFDGHIERRRETLRAIKADMPASPKSRGLRKRCITVFRKSIRDMKRQASFYSRWGFYRNA